VLQNVRPQKNPGRGRDEKKRKKKNILQKNCFVKRGKECRGTLVDRDEWMRSKKGGSGKTKRHSSVPAKGH